VIDSIDTRGLFKWLNGIDPQRDDGKPVFEPPPERWTGEEAYDDKDPLDTDESEVFVDEMGSVVMAAPPHAVTEEWKQDQDKIARIKVKVEKLAEKRRMERRARVLPLGQWHDPKARLAALRKHRMDKRRSKGDYSGLTREEIR
jgi:hypothetical protein